MTTKSLSPELLQQMDAYWRATNYLSVGQIYLYDNPLLKRPLTPAPPHTAKSKDYDSLSAAKIASTSAAVGTRRMPAASCPLIRSVLEES